MQELVPDPGFDDPAAWSFVGSGATVTGGQLRFANPVIASSQTIPLIVPVVGVEYEYSIDVDRVPSSAINERILFGGVEIFNQDGAGVKSGKLTAIDTSGLIFIAQLVGQWYLNGISIHMAHVRQQIRDEITTTLTGLTTTGSRVFRSKIFNVDPVQMPCLVVMTNQDVVEEYVLKLPRTQKRGLNILIQAIAGEATGVDNTLDDIAEEVEIAIAGNLTLGGLATSMALQSTEITFLNEGDRPYGVAELLYQCRYTVSENAPGG